MMATEKKFTTSKGQAWFCTTGLPSDIVIEVEEMSFHLHKFPLMARSKKLHVLIAEQEANPRRRRRRRRRRGSSASAAEVEVEGEEGIEEEEEEEGEEEEEKCQISLAEFPGGSEAFESAAKFCYGVKIELTASNVAPLRCAGEYLEMTEEFVEDNLISRTERFLAQFVLINVKDSIKTLKSCESLVPMAETLAIPQRCIESIAARASSSDPSSLFGWPVSDGDPKSKDPNLWNGIDAGMRRRNQQDRSAAAAAAASAGSWFDDLTVLSLPVYKRLISAMKERDLSSEIVESVLIAYAKKTIPGLSRSNRKHSSSSSASEAEQRELVETVITNLPLKKRSSRTTATTTRFLFGLLRTASILRASEGCRCELERRIAAQLEEATLDDLLLPSYSYLIETLYDVECVERILGYFLERIEEELVAEEEERGDGGGRSPAVNPVMLVGKLIDGYLAEIASDSNLSVERFYDLAVALPDQARLFDDGLYRAVDVYLKSHPWISEEDRDKLCGLMDCQKLTLEACTHAAQNERLPLRAVVQVLFFEQLQLRHAIAGSLLTSAVAPPPLPLPSNSSRSSHIDDASAQPAGDGDTWRATVQENQVLRLDMDSMRSRVHDLERECSTMRKAIEKIDRTTAVTGDGGGWSSFTKKFGCKFRTQVCDSHERTVVETKKVRQKHDQKEIQQQQESL